MWYGIGNTALANPSTIEMGVTGDGRLVALLEGDPVRLDAAVLGELRAWLVSVKEHLDRMEREMDLLLPWLEALRHAPAQFADAQPRLLDHFLEAKWGEIPEAVPVIGLEL